MKKSTGGNFLAKKADLTKSRMGGPALDDILIVEDENFDADRLRATLHIMFGYGIQVRRAKTLGSALDAVIERHPELVFLDDYLKPNDNATQTIPFLRRCGYEGPIVVVSGAVDRQRRVTLIKAGAVDVIHKDDLDSVRISEALARVHAAEAAAADTKSPVKPALASPPADETAALTAPAAANAPAATALAPPPARRKAAQKAE